MQTTRFGKVEIDDSQILTLPSGILGFSNEQHFVLLNDEEPESPFQWLHSMTTSDLAFVVMTPTYAYPDYHINLNEDHLRKLDAGSAEQVQIRCILTMARELSDITINLQGPLLLNLDKRIGLQLVIPDGKYNTRHPLFIEQSISASENKEQNSEKSISKSNQRAAGQ
jgi:flagellar assembly factor FliW